METRFGADHYVSPSKRVPDYSKGQIENHLRLLLETRMAEIAENGRQKDKITQEFLTEMSSVAGRNELREFKLLCRAFLLDHPGLDTEMSKIHAHNKRIMESLRTEQVKFAAALNLDLEKAGRIKKRFNEIISRQSTEAGALNKNMMSPAQLQPYTHFIKTGGGVDDNPDVSIYEAPFDGWRYSWCITHVPLISPSPTWIGYSIRIRG